MIAFTHNGLSYRTNADASIVEGQDGAGNWRRTFSLAVLLAARKAVEEHHKDVAI